MNNIKPLVSVIVCVYDGDDPIYIDAALKSVINQTYKNIELLIVLNGVSKNDILNCCNNYFKHNSNIRLLSISRNLGLANGTVELITP